MKPERVGRGGGGDWVGSEEREKETKTMGQKTIAKKKQKNETK